MITLLGKLLNRKQEYLTNCHTTFSLLLKTIVNTSFFCFHFNPPFFFSRRSACRTTKLCRLAEYLGFPVTGLVSHSAESTTTVSPMRERSENILDVVGDHIHTLEDWKESLPDDFMPQDKQDHDPKVHNTRVSIISAQVEHKERSSSDPLKEDQITPALPLESSPQRHRNRSLSHNNADQDFRSSSSPRYDRLLSPRYDYAHPSPVFGIRPAQPVMSFIVPVRLNTTQDEPEDEPEEDEPEEEPKDEPEDEPKEEPLKSQLVP